MGKKVCWGGEIICLFFMNIFSGFSLHNKTELQLFSDSVFWSKVPQEGLFWDSNPKELSDITESHIHMDLVCEHTCLLMDTNE